MTKTLFNYLILFSFLAYFSSCENADIANSAAAVEGTYSVNTISAKTSQGQSILNGDPEFDIITIKRKDDLIVDIQMSIQSASVKFGSSQQDYLKTVYVDVNVEMKSENNSFQLLKVLNQESNGSLSGTINENGKLTLTYRITGTEIFSISGQKR